MRSLQEAFGKVVAAILLFVFFPGVLSSQPGTLVHRDPDDRTDYFSKHHK